ncbi:zinc finger MYM-type protein 5-like [Triplophysa dalaica]|uniref:zinc finger MYM-type protein 5-like n=1 Tax=Triplophysa dalaica TaxID=1582913 RepID=UPI0024E03A70|nr:zinc finger MYM-type protein 5-like [Triplophysa dalaica]
MKQTRLWGFFGKKSVEGSKDELQTEEEPAAAAAAAAAVPGSDMETDDSGRREAELVEVASTVVEDLGTVETGPARAKLKEYPLTTFGLQRRSFQQKWFETFDWLEYSASRNAAFCFACRLFGKQVSRVNKDVITSSVGFSNWKRALDSFREHDSSSGHKASMLAFYPVYHMAV